MEKYSEYYSIARCRIKPDDLFNLEKAVQSGFPEESQFEVSTEFRNLKLSAKSVAELLKHDQVPDELVTLSLSCRYYGGNLMSIDKSVTIAFSTLGSHVWIEGKDEIWVAGKHQSLVRFFDSICGSGKPRLPLKPSFLRADLFVSLAIGLWFVAAYQVVSQLDLFFSSLFSVSSVYLLAKYVDWARWGTTSEAVKIVLWFQYFGCFDWLYKKHLAIQSQGGTMKTKYLVPFLVLITFLVALFVANRSAPAASSAEGNTYLPLIVRPVNTPTPSPTPLPTNTPTATATAIPPTPTNTPPAPPPPPPPAGCSICSFDAYNCSDFSTQASAQACFNYCWAQVGYDVHRLDQDNDGEACESLP